ncbi:hypothetical protein [Enterobacter kobei]|uniref:hypothetical protein n=1 Tax=Enterobacter kobei TaxID=208224 RepID=UPI003CEE80FD
MTNKHLPQAPVDGFLLFKSADGRASVGCRFQLEKLWITLVTVSKQMADNKAQAEYDLFARQQHRLTEEEGERDITELLHWNVYSKGKGV